MKDVIQQASFSSASTISRCEINPCERRQACHSPEDVFQFPFGTPLSEPLIKLKKLLEQNCTPEKVQYIFQLIEAGNLKDIDWEEAMRIPTEDPPPDLMPKLTLDCKIPPCDSHPGCHLPEDILQYPFGTPLSAKQVELKKLVEQNDSREKVKQFLEQLEVGNMKNVDCEMSVQRSEDLQPKLNVGNPYCPRLVSKLTSTSNCNFPPCEGHPGCHLPEDVLQYPFGTPLPPKLIELKKLIQQNDSREKVKQLFRQLEARNIKTCETFLKKSTDLQANHTFLKPKTMPCRSLPDHKCSKYDSRDEFLQHPLGTHLSPYLAELKKLLEQNNNPKKVQRIIDQIDNTNLKNEATDTLFSPDDYSTSKLVPKTSSCIMSCHSPDEILQYPYGTPLSPPLQTLKNILEKYYNPLKVKHLFGQIEAGNFRNLDWVGAIARPTDVSPDNNATSVPPQSIFCPNRSCGSGPSGCHLPEDLLQYPYGTPLATQLESVKKILQPNKNPRKVNRLFSQLESGKLKNLDWTGAMTEPTCCPPDEYSSSQPEPTTSVCHDPSCPARLGCHLPDKVLQYPYGTSLPQNLLRLKQSLEQNSNPNTCDYNNVDWVETLKTSTDFLSDDYPSKSVPTISTCRIPPCQGHPGCHLPDQVLQYPFGTPLPQNLVEFKKLLELNIDPKKMKRLFEEIEAGNLENLDWDMAMEILAELQIDDFDDVDDPPLITKPSAGTCLIPPCQGRPYCHSPDDLLEYPFGTPLPKHLKELKKLLEDNCSPETVRHLFEQIEAGDLEDFNNFDCEETVEIPVVIAPEVCPPTPCPPPICPPSVCPPSVSVGTDCSPPSGLQPGPLPSTVIILPPEVYAPKPKDEDCAVCHKPKYRDGVKMKCACSGKKKTVKIKPPCPCELHKVPISKEEPGLKIATRSIGDQCCICDEYSSKVKKSGEDVIFKLGKSAPSIIGVPGGPVSTGIQDGTGCIICPTGHPCTSEHVTCPKLTKTTISPVPLGFFGQPDKKSEMGELEIIGPKGGYAIVGPGGIYTQAGIKEIRFSSGAGTAPELNNVGAESTSKIKKNCLCFGKRKKKRKIVCQCPSESDQEPLLLYTYADFEEARKQSKIYKSNLTQTTSGFKVKKKKKPEATPEAQYTMEDAIRDYAVIRPDFIRDLVPPGVTRKGRKKDCACENDRGSGNYEILIPDGKGNFVLEKPEPVPEPEVPLPGLKITIGGKGSGSKGLAGICCFEMYQDS